MTIEEERIALLLDYENLAIGARDNLGVQFDFKPIAAALAERGRVVARKAYADWMYFDEDRRMLTRHQVELIEIPQRMGDVRKNAADIKMAVDAMDLCFERDYLTTFVIGTGDSDFTPLVHKLRELNKRVIGIGVKASTSNLLPPACDEFLFYERLEGVEPRRGGGRRSGRGRRGKRRDKKAPSAEGDINQLIKLVSQTLAGQQRGSSDIVRASMLKRALLRKDPTFSESDYGFRAFGELLRFLKKRNVVDLTESSAKGDPEVSFPEEGGGESKGFALLRTVVADIESNGETPVLSGLKDQMRKRQQDFSEKAFGYSGFLQFAKAARARGIVTLDWSDELEDYELHANGNG